MIEIAPIGFVRGGRIDPVDDHWGDVEATIELDPERFGPEALAGLEAFSHLVVLFHFHKVAEAAVETGARHPRGRTDWPKVGIFAQRGKARPNRLGVSVCRIRSVGATSIDVAGLDAIDGTPVVDLKPYMKSFAPRDMVREPSWAEEIMADYW